jgi:hypothetical protein
MYYSHNLLGGKNLTGRETGRLFIVPTRNWAHTTACYQNSAHLKLDIPRQSVTVNTFHDTLVLVDCGAVGPCVQRFYLVCHLKTGPLYQLAIGADSRGNWIVLQTAKQVTIATSDWVFRFFTLQNVYPTQIWYALFVRWFLCLFKGVLPTSYVTWCRSAIISKLRKNAKLKRTWLILRLSLQLHY